jgi:hypothetical protein
MFMVLVIHNNFLPTKKAITYYIEEHCKIQNNVVLVAFCLLY